MNEDQIYILLFVIGVYVIPTIYFVWLHAPIRSKPKPDASPRPRKPSRGLLSRWLKMTLKAKRKNLGRNATKRFLRAFRRKVPDFSLWESKTNVPVANRFWYARHPKHRGLRLLFAEYSDGTVTVKAYKGHRQTSATLLNRQRLSLSQEELFSMAKDKLAQMGPCTNSRFSSSEGPHSLIDDTVGKVTGALAEFYLPRTSDANRKLWMAGAFDHLTDKRTILARRHARSVRTAA